MPAYKFRNSLTTLPKSESTHHLHEELPKHYRRKNNPGQAGGAASSLPAAAAAPAKPDTNAAKQAAAANKASGWAKVAQKPKPKQKGKKAQGKPELPGYGAGNFAALAGRS